MTFGGGNPQGEPPRRVAKKSKKRFLWLALVTLLALIAARDMPLCHARLLDDLLAFHFDDARRRICLRWAQEFYGKLVPAESAPGGKEDACDI